MFLRRDLRHRADYFANQSVADSFLEKLGAALWVFDATLLGKATIAAPLQKLRSEGKPVIAVINRIDEFKDSIDEAYELLKKIYPNTFDGEVALSALDAFEAITRGETSEVMEQLWAEVTHCVGISAQDSTEARISRAAEQACTDLSVWVTSSRREVQDMIGLVDHMRENLKLSKQKLIEHLEGVLAEETDSAFHQVEAELSQQIAQLDKSPGAAAKIIDFFNDPRTQERITKEIFERTLVRINHLWGRYSDQAIDLSMTSVPIGGMSGIQLSAPAMDAKNLAMEEGVFAGGLSLAVAATIAATTAVTWPAILVAIPIGSLVTWKKRREISRNGNARDEFIKSMAELRRQFVGQFLPKAAIEIEQSLDKSIQRLIEKRCREILGEDDDAKARLALLDLRELEMTLAGTTSDDTHSEWSTTAVLKLLGNPGPRLVFNCIILR